MPINTVLVPPQSGACIHVPAGGELRIIDVEGTQVADMFAVSAADRDEWLSVSHTRGANWRLFPAVGGRFVSTNYRPMLTFGRDDSPGSHDALFSACDPLMYQSLGFEGHHPSCAENFRTAASEIDWNPHLVPDPVNFFQRTPVSDEGDLSTQPAASGPGDSVTLVAEMDLYAIVTACSMDLKNINGDRCTSILLEVT